MLLNVILNFQAIIAVFWQLLICFPQALICSKTMTMQEPFSSDFYYSNKHGSWTRGSAAVRLSVLTFRDCPGIRSSRCYLFFPTNKCEAAWGLVRWSLCALLVPPRTYPSAPVILVSRELLYASLESNFPGLGLCTRSFPSVRSDLLPSQGGLP